MAKLTLKQQTARIEQLEQEGRAKSDLITAQLGLAEERNAHILELEAALTAAQATIEAQAAEIATLRRLLDIDEADCTT